LAELGRDFPEVESRDYESKTVSAKKAKAWKNMLTKFNSQNPNSIKRDLSQLQLMLEVAETSFKKRA